LFTFGHGLYSDDPMLMLAVSFWLFTLFGCAFAAGFGGRDGRFFAATFLAGVLLTIVAQLTTSRHGTQYWVMAIDSAFFVGMVWLALRSTSYWPVWAAGSQLMTVLTHVVTLLLQSFSDRIYEGLSTVWVIPMLLFTLIGIELDRKYFHDRPYPA
jgi:hypothetical protein